jgi:hypothetical protein
MVPQGRNTFRRILAARISNLVERGLWTGVALAASGLLGFILLAEFRAGPWIAGLGALGAYGFLAYVLPKRLRASDGLDALPSNLATSTSTDPRVELLVGAHQHVAGLVKARDELPLEVGKIVDGLTENARAIIEAVSLQPDKLNPVLRFFTYYLPATEDLVLDRIKLAPYAGSERLAELDHTLSRLGEAFASFRVGVLEPDLASVDIDISLLEDALDADLEDLKKR